MCIVNRSLNRKADPKNTHIYFIWLMIYGLLKMPASGEAKDLFRNCMLELPNICDALWPRRLLGV